MTSRSCWSATSPRTATSPGRACSNTSSTRCCSSKATGTTRCASCGRSSTVSARRTNSDCSRWSALGLAGGSRPVHDVPRRPPHRRGRLGRRAHHGGSTPDRRRAAGAHVAGSGERAEAAQRTGHRRRPPVDADGGARSAGSDEASATRTCTPRRPAERNSTEPGLDLGICLAVASAMYDRPLPADMAVFGEVGLGGEVRQVSHAPRRVTEAARLGFRRVIVPAKSPDPTTRWPAR